jgi:hypothetical protein
LHLPPSLCIIDESTDYEKLYRESKKNRQEAKREQERAERALREATDPTTFSEFIKYCHIYISEPLQIETNKERSTGGQLTSPKGRLCPTYLKPWDDFQRQQAAVYLNALGCLESLENPKLFLSRTALQGLGNQLCRHPQSSEGDLWSYAQHRIENPAVEVLDALRTNSDFPLGDRIQFYNHANAFDDEPIHPQAQKRMRSQPNRFCVQQKDSESSLKFPIKDKASHKLMPKNLRAGLRPMNVWKEVVQRPTIPLDRDKKLEYNAELLTNSALTHAYDSMMHHSSETVWSFCILTRMSQKPYATPWRSRIWMWKQ